MLSPYRLSEPDDISRFFSDIFLAVYLKEYTAHDLRRLFVSVGFRRTGVIIGGRGRYATVKPYLIEILERLLGGLPVGPQNTAARSLVIGARLGVRLFGVK